MSKAIPGPLCSGSHDIKLIYFCQNCAGHRQAASKVIYCEGCHPEFRTAHQGHTKYSIKSDQFLKNYKKFKENLRKETILEFFKKYKQIKSQSSREQSINFFKSCLNDSNVSFKYALLDTDLDKKLLAEFQNQLYREWLIGKKFWEEKSYMSSDMKSEMQKLIKSILTQKLGSNKPQANPWALAVTLNKKPSGAAATDYNTQMDLLRQKVDDLTKQKHLGQLYLRLTSYFTDQEIQNGLDEIDSLKEEFSSMPFLLYLAKLKILELHSAGSDTIRQILADKNFPKDNSRQEELYYYFMALSQWEVVNIQLLGESETGDTLLFYQARNKCHYKLSNPKRYVETLDKAIRIHPRPLYYASRALGQMIQGKYVLAEEDFNLAERQKFKSDALLNNRMVNNIKRKKELDRSVLKEAIHQKTTEYLSNLSKHLKNTKDYDLLKLYCEELVNRQPKNVAFRLKKFEVAFKLRDKDGAKEELGCLKNLNELDQVQLLECQRKIELLKAQENEKLGNYEDAESKYEHVAEMGDDVATYWYNYAAFLFNYREKLEKNEKALMAINKAIEIKPKKQYKKLKYLLLVLCGNMEEAKNMHQKDLFLGQELKQMREYIDDSV